MPVNEKEYNGNLLDQMTIVERLKRAYKNGIFEEEAQIILDEINRKLYQDPGVPKKE